MVIHSFYQIPAPKLMPDQYIVRTISITEKQETFLAAKTFQLFLRNILNLISTDSKLFLIIQNFTSKLSERSFFYYRLKQNIYFTYHRPNILLRSLGITTKKRPILTFCASTHFKAEQRKLGCHNLTSASNQLVGNEATARPPLYLLF